MSWPWRTREKACITLLVAATLFILCNVVYFGFVEGQMLIRIDLATLRREFVTTWRLGPLGLSRRTTSEETPASQALKGANCTTGLAGKAGIRTHWCVRKFPPAFGGGYLNEPHHVVHNGLVVELIRRKGREGLPTLRRILADLRPPGVMTDREVLAVLREDFPTQAWPASRPAAAPYCPPPGHAPAG